MYQSNRQRGQNRGIYQGRFRSNNAYRGCSRYNQDIRGRMRYSSNNRGSYGYNMRGNQRYGRNNNKRMVVIGIKVMIGIGVNHLKGRVEIGEIVKA